MVTNYIRGASYKEIYDLHNDSESTSILTIHSPITNLPRQMLGGFFKQYRRFKYRGCKVTLRPASTLPADPEQISYAPGDVGIDPRDMLNPILARGYCGDSLGTFLNMWNMPGVQRVGRSPTVGDSVEISLSDGFSGSSADRASFTSNLRQGDTRSYYFDKLYYQSLSDPGFHKIKMQRGYSRFVRPLTYELATTTQYLAKPQQLGLVDKALPSSSVAQFETSLNVVGSRESMADVHTVQEDYLHDSWNVDPETKAAVVLNSSGTNRVIAQHITKPVLTSGKRPLGWLDTDTVVNAPTTVQGAQLSSWGTAYSNALGMTGIDQAMFNTNYSETVLPLINMMVLILPKAYKQEMFYRLSLTHVFDFKDYRPLHGLVSPFDGSAINGGTLEWCDWDDNQIVEAGPSVTSTSKNFELVDVVGDSAPVADDAS